MIDSSKCSIIADTCPAHVELGIYKELEGLAFLESVLSLSLASLHSHVAVTTTYHISYETLYKHPKQGLQQDLETYMRAARHRAV